MNYLAHLSLSGDHFGVALGNLMCDILKGKPWKGAGDEIHLGMQVHLTIDALTDAHARFKEMVQKVRPVAGHFSGVVIDVLIDHHLHRHWRRWHQDALADRLSWFWKGYSSADHGAPDRIKTYLTQMKDIQLLESYESYAGVQDALLRIERRLRKRSGREFHFSDSIRLMQDHHAFFEQASMDVYGDVGRALDGVDDGPRLEPSDPLR